VSRAKKLETDALISIKKYLDSNEPIASDDGPELNDLVTVTMESYRSVLRAFGKSAVHACPAPGQELEAGLAGLATSLSKDTAPKAIKQTQIQAEQQLSRWGSLTAEHLKAKADEVKDLLMILARTAESVGERDQRYSSQFAALTTDLKAIANLDDLTQVRSSLVRKAAELKNCVDQMAQDGRQSLAQLRTKVSTYETQLKAVEQLAAKDSLTGLANRRGVERRLEWLVARGEPFCIVVLDLNSFKRINDEHGHAEGDELLRKFSEELQRNVRTEDTAGRWGGDEFIIVLNRDLAGAKSQVSRIQDWVFGDYEIRENRAKGALTVHVSASIGLAQWLPGKTVRQLLEEADADMYLDKKKSRKGK
jgi:diguanylate cyclase (GGDEF)-like protein